MISRQTARTITLVMFFGCCMSAFGQPKSAVEFYDTTGTQSVSKFGWTGDANTGNFYIRTPNDGNGVTVKQGNVTANKVTADGSGLTNIPPEAVNGLNDSLSRKAASGHVHSTSAINGLTDSLAAKANASSTPTKTYVDTNLAKKAGAIHSHALTDVTWDTASSGQVWKMGSNGQPAWGADATGGTGVALPIGMTDVAGLSDSVTNHRTAINGKAPTTHAHAVGEVTGLQTTLGGKADTSYSYTKGATDAKVAIKADTTWVKGKIPTALPPNGAAGGDLTGLYPNPTIGTGKVTSAQIATGTIAQTNLNAALSDKIENGASIGGAYNTNINNGALAVTPFDNTSGDVVILSTTITAPADGFAFVTVSTSVSNRTTTGVNLWVNGIVCEGTSPTNADPRYTVVCPSQGEVRTFSLTRPFAVTAGAHTYSLVFNNASTAPCGIQNPLMSVLFIKQQL